jgi:hypothetical protein
MFPFTVFGQADVKERGGPPVRTPNKNGFGSLLIKTSFPNAQMDFGHDGLTCEIESPIGQQRGDKEPPAKIGSDRLTIAT